MLSATSTAFSFKVTWLVLMFGLALPRSHLKVLLIRNVLENSVYKQMCRASLVAQWLKIHLPIQGTRVRALVQEDPTCHGATKPVCHNY